MIKNFNKFHMITLCLLLLGIFLRFYHLAERPLHHDESLHTFYAQQQAISFQHSFYKYNPMLHGPALYDITTIILKVLPDSKFTWRLPAVLAGSILLVMLLLIFQKAPPSWMIIFTTISILSPEILYWSRFLRNDIFIVLLHIWLFWELFYSSTQRKLILIPIILSLQFTFKENSFITLFQLVILSGMSIQSSSKKIIHLSKYKYHLAAGLIIATLVYILIYSSFFHHPAGILDGLYRKSLLYWFKQHNTARITGPFIFQSTILFWYAPILVIALCITIIHMIWHLSLKIKRIILLSTFFLMTTLIIPPFSPFQHSTDLFWFILYAICSIIFPLFFLRRQQPPLFYLSGMLFSSLLIYSFVGEKVPWLSIYPYIYLLLFLFYYWKEIPISKKLVGIILVVTISISGSLTIETNFHYSPQEPIHQVASTPELEQTIFRLKKTTSLFLLKGEFIWPAHPFLYNNPYYSFHANSITKFSKFTHLLLGVKEKKRWDLALRKDYTSRPIIFRRYWWPRLRDYNLKAILTFLLFRSPTSLVTEQKAYLYTRR